MKASGATLLEASVEAAKAWLASSHVTTDRIVVECDEDLQWTTLQAPIFTVVESTARRRGSRSAGSEDQ